MNDERRARLWRAYPNTRPVIALDVDGVLEPWRKPEYGRWLNNLARHGELVWATSWEHLANAHIAPAIGIPQLPVIELGLDKLPAVAQWVGERPLVWIDDVFGKQDHAKQWAMERSADGYRTLLLAPEASVGLTEFEVLRAYEWLRWNEDHPPGLM